MYDDHRYHLTEFIFCSMEHLKATVSWDDSGAWKEAMSNATIESMYNDPDPGAQPVAGHCPMGCGQKLALDRDAKVYCQNPMCPDQHAMHTIMADSETEHLVYVESAGWTVRHPLRERIGNALDECEVTKLMQRMGAAPLAPGTYRVHKSVHDSFLWEDV